MITAKQALKAYKKIDSFPVHESYRGIRNFLKSLEVRDQFDGVTYFGKTNCNYILFPSGFLLANYGYHGISVMHRVREFGAKIVEIELREAKTRLHELIYKQR